MVTSQWRNVAMSSLTKSPKISALVFFRWPSNLLILLGRMMMTLRRTGWWTVIYRYIISSTNDMFSFVSFCLVLWVCVWLYFFAFSLWVLWIQTYFCCHILCFTNYIVGKWVIKFSPLISIKNWKIVSTIEQKIIKVIATFYRNCKFISCSSDFIKIASLS